jgi:catechol 2,3-dioxygenase-like lactoylglutathione lyase family enzyme
MVAATFVRDIRISRAFYELLGFSEQSAGHAATSAWSSLQHGDHLILLVSNQPPLELPKLPLLFYFYFDDLDAVVSLLEARGVTYTHLGYPPHTPHGEIRLNDPDGNTVLIGQQEPSSLQARHGRAG